MASDLRKAMFGKSNGEDEPIIPPATPPVAKLMHLFNVMGASLANC